jgi:hypothetical protein
MGTDTNGDDKNEVRSAVTPDHKDYARIMGQAPMAPMGCSPTGGYGQPPEHQPSVRPTPTYAQQPAQAPSQSSPVTKPQWAE